MLGIINKFMYIRINTVYQNVRCCQQLLHSPGFTVLITYCKNHLYFCTTKQWERFQFQRCPWYDVQFSIAIRDSPRPAEINFT